MTVTLASGAVVARGLVLQAIADQLRILLAATAQVVPTVQILPGCAPYYVQALYPAIMQGPCPGVGVAIPQVQAMWREIVERANAELQPGAAWNEQLIAFGNVYAVDDPIVSIRFTEWSYIPPTCGCRR